MTACYNLCVVAEAVTATLLPCDNKVAVTHTCDNTAKLPRQQHGKQLCKKKKHNPMSRRWVASALVGAILVRAAPAREAETWARGEVDFVDLAGGTVVSPFRWRARLYGAPRAAPAQVDVMVLIDDNYFQEFPGGLPPLGGFSGAEMLPAGSHARPALPVLIPRPAPARPPACAPAHPRACGSEAPAAY